MDNLYKGQISIALITAAWLKQHGVEGDALFGIAHIVDHTGGDGWQLGFATEEQFREYCQLMEPRSIRVASMPDEDVAHLEFLSMEHRPVFDRMFSALRHTTTGLYH